MPSEPEGHPSTVDSDTLHQGNTSSNTRFGRRTEAELAFGGWTFRLPNSDLSITFREAVDRACYLRPGQDHFEADRLDRVIPTTVSSETFCRHARFSLRDFHSSLPFGHDYMLRTVISRHPITFQEALDTCPFPPGQPPSTFDQDVMEDFYLPYESNWRELQRLADTLSQPLMTVIPPKGTPDRYAHVILTEGSMFHLRTAIHFYILDHPGLSRQELHSGFNTEYPHFRTREAQDFLEEAMSDYIDNRSGGAVSPINI